MDNYKHILVALDLSQQAQEVLNKAASLAKQNKATLSVVHVTEAMTDVATHAFDGSIAIDLLPLQKEIQAGAIANIKKLTAPFNIPAQQQHILTGHAANEIHDFSEHNNCDLIIIGSHGRQGLALLLGSTANAVLHGAKCDVLAVRFKN